MSQKNTVETVIRKARTETIFTVTIAATVSDAQALYDAAVAHAERNGMTPEQIEEFGLKDDEGEIDPRWCLQMLLDPGHLSARDGDRVHGSRSTGGAMSKLIEGALYDPNHRPVKLTRKEWQDRIAKAIAEGGRRRVEDGETFIHAPAPNPVITAEIYANIPAPKREQT
jgi:hypothetical protein